MKLGFLSAILPDLSFEEVIDYAAELGLACVEVACWPSGNATRRYSGVTHIDMEHLDEAQAKKLADYAKGKNVQISGIGYYPNPLHTDPEVRKAAGEHIRACIRGARLLGVPVVNTFIGRSRLDTPEKNMELFLSVWPPLIDYAREHGIKIGIENCPMYFKDEWPNGDNLASSPAFWRTMFEKIDSAHFGLNYDPSHLVWRQMDYLKPLYNFTDKLFHLHAKDAAFDRDSYDQQGPFAPPLSYHQPRLPGRGSIDWKKFMDALYDINYQGPLVVEVEDVDFEGSVADRKKAIRLSVDHLRQFLR